MNDLNDILNIEDKNTLKVELLSYINTLIIQDRNHIVDAVANDLLYDISDIIKNLPMPYANNGAPTM